MSRLNVPASKSDSSWFSWIFLLQQPGFYRPQSRQGASCHLGTYTRTRDWASVFLRDTGHHKTDFEQRDAQHPTAFDSMEGDPSPVSWEGLAIKAPNPLVLVFSSTVPPFPPPLFHPPGRSGTSPPWKPLQLQLQFLGSPGLTKFLHSS